MYSAHVHTERISILRHLHLSFFSHLTGNNSCEHVHHLLGLLTVFVLHVCLLSYCRIYVCAVLSGSYIYDYLFKITPLGFIYAIEDRHGFFVCVVERNIFSSLYTAQNISLKWKLRFQYSVFFITNEFWFSRPLNLMDMYTFVHEKIVKIINFSGHHWIIQVFLFFKHTFEVSLGIWTTRHVSNWTDKTKSSFTHPNKKRI